MASSCETNCGLLGTGTIRNPIEILAPVIESGIDPLMVLGMEFPLNSFLFDSQLNNEGDTLMGLKLKNINVVGAKYTNGNCALEWTEKYDCPLETDIVSVAGAVITVADVTKLRGVNTNSTLLLSDATTGATETVTVVSVVGNNITVNPAPTVTAGKVSRLAYSTGGSACNAVANNTYTSVSEGVYSSPFRRLWLSMDFQQCDLSVQRYAYGDPAKAFLDDMIRSASVGARNEFESVFYFDNGWTTPATSNPETNRTLGLIPGIQYAQGVANKNFVHDFSLVCSSCPGTDCEKDEAVVAAFYEILMSMYKSGLYNNKSITLIANTAQYEALQRLEKAFADYHQITVVYNPGDSFQSIYGNLNMIRIPFAYVNVDIYLDRALDKIAVPFMIGLPAHNVFVAQRPFMSADVSESGNIRVLNNSLASGNPRFKMIDRTKIEGNGTGECMILKAFMDIAIIPQGIFSGAYRIFINLAPCSSTCNPLCVTGAPTLVSPITFN
ncbi:MAG TPA: hypothetical protein PLW93_02430 [Candidatus Absconditabacterales bacterium]|nr:hypothetical protein [Candidatus Absconditabacterales bacterium]